MSAGPGSGLGPHSGQGGSVPRGMMALRGSRCPAGWLPALQLLRRGSKAVTRHWKAVHFQRQKLLALTEYLAPRPALPPRCLPRPGPRQQQEDGYARVLRAQLEATLRASRMVAVCQYNAMADEDVATLRHFLRRHDIHVKFGQTVAALSLLPSQTCSLLQRGPALLAALLEQHLRRLRGAGGAAEPAPGPVTGSH
uniref:Large ribosomal subunit protein uL10m n=1 Tax=Geospiza parvula TaxID=87175 RepID=A0A8U8B7U2_GEOPR